MLTPPMPERDAEDGENGTRLSGHDRDQVTAWRPTWGPEGHLHKRRRPGSARPPRARRQKRSEAGPACSHTRAKSRRGAGGGFPARQVGHRHGWYGEYAGVLMRVSGSSPAKRRCKNTGRCPRRGRCVRHVRLPPCVLCWPWLWWRVQEQISAEPRAREGA